MIKKSKILWFSWKDCRHLHAGGAEIVSSQIARRLAAEGHEIIFITGGFPNGLREEVIDGYRVIRLGNRWTVYFQAYFYYQKNLKGWPDLVIDEINTVPFFCKFYTREKNIIFIHQLCRQIWFYQISFPLSLMGYLIEPFYLLILKDRKVITVSESTKENLVRFGFRAENISIISEGIEIEPIKSLNMTEKFATPTMLSLGTVRPMKKTKEIVKAFELAKEKIKDLKLIIAGSIESPYGWQVRKMIGKSKFRKSVEITGPVSKEKKIELLKKSHILCVASIKEGWGLIVTEAASQGTPAVVYNVDGLRDSVKADKTGLVCDANNPKCLAKLTITLFLDQAKYKNIQKNAWQWSKEINFEKSYEDFIRAMEKYMQV